MRTRVLGPVGLLAAAVTAVAVAATPLKATLTMATHAPRVNKRYYYVVRVTRDGKPVRAKLTMNIVDPVGGVHPVEFGPSTKVIKNWPIRGSFRDYMIFPRESRGVPLVMRATLVTTKGRAVARFKVVPR
jgi:hypothetical protein